MKVCYPALQILTLFQSNSYKVNVREYSPGISYIENKDYQLTLLTYYWQSMLSEGSYILGDPGAASQDDGMFVVKVYYKIEKSPWALTLTESVPEAFELPPSDWPEI